MVEVLSKEDKENILAALKDVETLRKELQKAKRAGIDVSELEAKLREAELALTNLRKVYISGQ